MIERMFERLAARGETALIAYLPAGFPTLPESMELLKTVAASGADLIELGVPYCDPVADGPTIQQATQRALDGGTTLRGILDALDDRAAGGTSAVPISLMSYLNPLLAFGREALLVRMATAGCCGLIVPDLPLEEAGVWIDQTTAHGIALSLLVAPTSSPERSREIAHRSRGFVYYVSVTGITGAREALPDDLFSSLARIKEITTLPVAVGFGISTPAQVRLLRGRADAVVVGSRIVRAIQDGEDVAKLIRALKAATRS